MKTARVRAVLFDVDFTLIYPGPTFMGEGYRAFSAKHGMDVDASRFELAVASAAAILDTPDDTPYDDELYVAYTRHIIEQMGGAGDRLDACAREIYAEWAACRHFELYEEVPGVLRVLVERGISVGLVSNSHRSLSSFAAYFNLEGLIGASVSSSEHGLMKPHPSIFNAVLDTLRVDPSSALMVGDSIRHDVEGGIRAGMRAVFLHRSGQAHPRAAELAAMGVPIIRSLRELPVLLDPQT